jgi:2,3-dihydroxybenzoate-AMP ligase
MTLPGFTEFPSEFAARYREERYWRGEVLGTLMREWAEKDPGRTAIIEPDRYWSYGELDHRTDRVAAGLAALGIGRKDRVVIQLPNIAEFAVATIALFRLGAIPVFALPSHRRAEIIYLSTLSEAVAYITVDSLTGFDYRELAKEVIAAAKTLKHVIVVGDAGEFVPFSGVDGEPRQWPGPEPSDVAFFLLSGGTTGLPKLIPRTHDDYAYQLRATAAGLAFDETGVYLAALPVAHNAALGCPGLLGSLRVGGKTALLLNASPDEAFPMVDQEGVTLTTLMPPLVHLWLEAAEFSAVDFSGLLLQVGSARFAPELARRAVAELGCRLTHWFGMAEGLLTFTRLSDPDSVVFNTVGRPLAPADEIRVVDDEDRDVPTGVTGELLTRGPYTLRGYYQADEHNARAFTPDGFLRTGDLVSLTPEGNMVVQGRCKDVINRGGEKISPAELEDLLIEHPKVREAAVIPMPDEILGERICACVVPRQDPVSLTEIRQFLRERGIAEYKMPEHVENMSSFPRTKIGKLNKTSLCDGLAKTSQARAANV